MKIFAYAFSFLYIVSSAPLVSQPILHGQSLSMKPTISSVSLQIQYDQSPIGLSTPPQFSPDIQNKIWSADVLNHLARKASNAQAYGETPVNAFITVAIYATAYPSASFLLALESYGVRTVATSWIPPLENHTLGYFMAQVPTDHFADVLALADVKAIDTAEREVLPLNNLAATAIKANIAWANKWIGTGVTVGVLDSGFDDRMPASELPIPIAKRNYSSYPSSIDTNVRNTVTAHGTHVVGSVLGRGGWSTANIANGGRSYKGMAPNANLVFLRIGDAVSGSASNAAIVGAIKSAADSFAVKIISMSYGGWDTYHDGSDVMSQAVDYAYSKGVACFMAAGNDGAAGHHVSGIALARYTQPISDTSEYFQISVTAAGSNTAYIALNLVWAGGTAHNGLTLLYYDAAKSPISTVSRYAPTTSPRGTVSEISYYSLFVPSGNSTYYVRVLNSSSSVKMFHIYAWPLLGSYLSNVVFATPDPDYTVASPALADHAFAVGASVSRLNWTACDGFLYFIAGTLFDIANFSSRGPRIDGLQKPNITAPGKVIVSLRDRDVLNTQSVLWIDNDGTLGDSANYYVMQGTSMATPICAGAAALIYQYAPTATVQEVYDALTLNAVNDAMTSNVPNSIWGYGKLDVNGAINNVPLSVELSAFTALSLGNSVILSWTTASEKNNYGFEIGRKPIVHSSVSRIHSIDDQHLWSTIGFVAGSGTSNAVHAYSYVDRLTAPGAYFYRLKHIDRDGTYAYSTEIIVNQDTAPIGYSLAQNFPNPFNSDTHIQFSIGGNKNVRVIVYDMIGRTVATLVNEPLHVGRYSVLWNGDGVAGGLYFYRIDTGNFSTVKKLILLK